MAEETKDQQQEPKQEAQEGIPAHLVDEKRPDRDVAVDTISGNFELMDVPKLSDDLVREAADAAGEEPKGEAGQDAAAAPAAKAPATPQEAQPQQPTGKVRSSDDPRFEALPKQDRVNILVREKWEAKRAAAMEAEERRKLQAEIEAMRAGAPAAAAPQAPAAPPVQEPAIVRPDVQDPKFYTEDGEFVRSEWDKALVEYEQKIDEAREKRLLAALDKKRAEEQRKIEEQEQEKSALAVRDQFLAREAEYRAAHPDYGDAAENLRPLLWDASGRPRNPALAFFVMNDPDALQIVHTLGKDLERAENYVKADPLTLGMLLAQDKAQIQQSPRSAPQTPQPSRQAPVPPSLGGSSKPSSKGDDDFAAYAKSRGLGHLVAR